MTDKAPRTLAGLELFEGLAPARIAALDQRCGWRQYKADEQIFDRESDARDVFFVVAGKVRVVNYSASGREISFDDIGAGSYFGELAAIDGQPRSANVVALTDTTVASMSPQAFTQLCTEHPAIAVKVMRRLCNMVRTATSRIMDLSTHGAHNRIYAELLRESRANPGSPGLATIHPLPIHADIAARVSTTRETVARVLSDLTRKKLVKRQGDDLVILDVVRLRQMVERFEAE